MNWKILIQGFKSYLQLEKSLSENSVDAYLRDVEKLCQFFDYKKEAVAPTAVELEHLQEFLKWINELGVSAKTQARILSGIRAFYKYLLMEDMLSNDPTALVEAPKTGRKLPDTLEEQEIDGLISAIDLSKPEGTRN